MINVLWQFYLVATYTCSLFVKPKNFLRVSQIIWYGAWIKRPSEKRKMLMSTLVSTKVKSIRILLLLTIIGHNPPLLLFFHKQKSTVNANLSHLAILLDYGFFEAYAGESKDEKGGLINTAAKFATGDTISMTAVLPKSEDVSELSYACLAVMRSCFLRMEGVVSGVCFKCLDKPMVASLHVWKSLHSCYSWLLTSDHRKLISPYINHLSARVDYDLFRVEYVSSDDVVNFRHFLPARGQSTVATNHRGSGKGVA